MRGLAAVAAGSLVAANPAPAPAQEPAWASQWPPTALPGALAKMATAEDPCPRCGGRHEWLTSGCVPVLFVGDDNPVPSAYEAVAPPNGLHVMELNCAPGVEGLRYAVVRQ